MLISQFEYRATKDYTPAQLAKLAKRGIEVDSYGFLVPDAREVGAKRYTLLEKQYSRDRRKWADKRQAKGLSTQRASMVVLTRGDTFVLPKRNAGIELPIKSKIEPGGNFPKNLEGELKSTKFWIDVHNSNIPKAKAPIPMPEPNKSVPKKPKLNKRNLAIGAALGLTGAGAAAYMLNRRRKTREDKGKKRGRYRK